MAPGFERCLSAHEVPAPLARAAVDTMRRDHRVPDLLAFREVERRVLRAMREMLSLLDEEWGKWRIQRDVLVFEGPRALERYRKVKADMDAATVEETEIQRRLTPAPERAPKGP
jgi:hypothetical protein